MSISKIHADKWALSDSCELRVAEETFFRNSDLFLKNQKDIKNEISSIINKEVTNQVLSVQIKTIRKEETFIKRINATKLNIGIRANFKKSRLNFRYEVTHNEGVFYDSNRSRGFDFSLIDETYNLVNFRNYCYGRRAIHNGPDKWKEELSKRKDWSYLSEQLFSDSEVGLDLKVKKINPTILGEIQFGNWALAHRDILKVISTQKETDVDLFIYITATGDLSKALSSSTVNFKNMESLLNEFKNVLSMPVWLIGIDLK